MSAIRLAEQMEGGKLKIGSTTYDISEIKTSQGIVWPLTATYTLSNIVVTYIDGEGNTMAFLHPNASVWHAYVTGTLTGTRGGQVISTETVTLTPVNYYSSDRIVISGTNVLWNKTRYGRTTKTATTVDIKVSYSITGQTLTEDATLSVGANSSTSRRYDRTITLSTSTPTIMCTDTSIKLSPVMVNYYMVTWTSGEEYSDTDSVGSIDLYVGGVKQSGTFVSGREYTITGIGDNKHSLDSRTISCYAKKDSTQSTPSLEIEQAPDSKYPGTPTILGYYASADPISNDIGPTGGSAKYEISAYHVVETAMYWTSDNTRAGDPVTDTIEDDWGYSKTSGTDTYFEASKNGDYFELEHSNMHVRAATDTVSYKFYNLTDTTAETQPYTFDATNAITGSTYSIDLSVERTTISALGGDISITRAHRITRNTYTTGEYNDVSSAAYADLSLSGTGFSFQSSKTIVRANENTGSSERVATITLTWSGYCSSRSVTITQEAAVVPSTFSVTPTSSTVDYLEQGILYTVVAHGAWTATPNKDWIRSASGEGSRQVVIFVDENGGNTIRTGTLTFVCGTESVTVTIRQTRRF